MGGDSRKSRVYSNVKVDVFTGKFSNRYLGRLERAFGLTQRSKAIFWLFEIANMDVCILCGPNSSNRNTLLNVGVCEVRK